MRRRLSVYDGNADSRAHMLYSGFTALGGDGSEAGLSSYHIRVSGDNDGRAVMLEFDEHGGRVHVFGKGKNMSAVMGVNEYGSGAISTWDKNGYRLASLK